MNQPMYPQQPGYPAQPQPGYPPQQAAAPVMPAQATGQVAQIQAGAMQQVFNDVVHQPMRQVFNRDKIDDGTYVVQFGTVELKPSQKDGRMMILIPYKPIEGTVPQCVGRDYTYPMMLGNRMQLQDMSDLGKDIWGQEQMVAWAQQQVPFLSIAQSIAQHMTGKYAKLTARRNLKNGTVAYEEAFVNHTFREIADQPPQLGMGAQPGLPPAQPGAMQPPMMSGPPAQPGMPPAGAPPVAPAAAAPATPPMGAPPAAAPAAAPAAPPAAAPPAAGMPPAGAPPMGLPPVQQPGATPAPPPVAGMPPQQ